MKALRLNEKGYTLLLTVFELIALSAITCPAKLCETCQKNFPPFFDVKIEEIML